VVLGEGQSMNRIFAAPDLLIDLRTGERVLSVVDARGRPTLTAAEWPLSFSGDREVVESASPLGERVVSPVNARATSCCSSPDGAWVACASDQGHIVVTDRRAGRYRTSFRAHGAGIVCVKAASRHENLQRGLGLHACTNGYV